MPVISFNLTKIFAERSNAKSNGVKVRRDVKLNDVHLVNMEMTKAQVLHISFSARLIYETKQGSIDMNGELLYLDEESKLKEIAQEYEKTKTMTPELMEYFLNFILTKTNLESLNLCEKVGLPLPIQMPKAKLTEANKEEKKE